MSDGPYVIIAAFWQDKDNADEIAAALRVSKFPVPDGYPRGAVVAFRREVAMRPDFARDLGRFDLADVHDFSAVGDEPDKPGERDE